MTSKAFENATDANRQQGGRRNLIINGDQRIAQRSTSATAQQSGAAQYLTADRFLTYFYGVGVATQEQVSDAPTDFNFSTKFTVTNPDASIGGSDDYIFGQRIEGFNVAQLNFGTANAKTFTVSFWLKCSSTGTLAVAFQNSAGNRSYVTTVDINFADTWEYKTLTVTGDTTGTWIGATNGLGLSLYFSLGNSKQVTADTWSAGNYLGVSTATNFMATNGLTFQITGVQLEVGSVATPFEHRSYGEELALCQRYFQWLVNEGYPDGEYNADQLITSIYNSTRAFTKIFLKTVMRSTPTVTESSVGGTLYSNGASSTITGLSTAYPEVSGIGLDFGGSGFPSGNAGHSDMNDNTRIQADAEL